MYKWGRDGAKSIPGNDSISGKGPEVNKHLPHLMNGKASGAMVW